MSDDKPLAGHALLRWGQTFMIDGFHGGIDHPLAVFGCSCGQRGPADFTVMAQWFIAHLLTVLGADGGPHGFGRIIDDDEAQRLWFSHDEQRGDR